MMKVEVIYALPDQQDVCVIEVSEGSTVQQAVEQSGLLPRYPELSESSLMLGIFGRKVESTVCLSAGDRVEIYRPLIIDPKKARMIRAQKKALKLKP